MPDTLWIGGWASDLSAWADALAALYPGRGHRFLDAHAILDGRADLAAEAARLGPDDGLAAWSLGSLLVHRALEEGWKPSCRVLSLCPIFDFCRPGGPWPRAAVARMARRVSRDRGNVLAEFRAAAWGRSAVPPALAAAWERRAAEYDEGSLARGLSALADTRLDASSPSLRMCLFLTSTGDPLAPDPWGAGDFPARRAYPGGHLPFLDFPELVGPLLRGDGKSA